MKTVFKLDTRLEVLKDEQQDYFVVKLFPGTKSEQFAGIFPSELQKLLEAMNGEV